jgi:hypothetical protein
MSCVLFSTLITSCVSNFRHEQAMGGGSTFSALHYNLIFLENILKQIFDSLVLGGEFSFVLLDLNRRNMRLFQL